MEEAAILHDLRQLWLCFKKDLKNSFHIIKPLETVKDK